MKEELKNYSLRNQINMSEENKNLFDRNFRSYYYDKVGFRGVEEKKSLEILLKDKPIDLDKLRQFCLRFSLPSMYREYVWKLLLGILSPNVDSHKLVSCEQKELCKDLENSLQVMQVIDGNTPTAKILAYMLLLEKGQLMLNKDRKLQEPATKNLIAIASVFMKISSSKEDAYWMLRTFTKFQQKFFSATQILPDRMEAILKKNDIDLSNHLENVNVLHKLPTKIWFERCFAEILPESALERIWDKVIAGSSKILFFVGAALLMILRRPLLGMNSADEILNYLTNVPNDTADLVANKALELWQLKHKEER